MSVCFERKLGDSEISYFLPSREDGVNDMYLHLGGRSSTRIVNDERLQLAWAILRGRHPLLAASVVMEPGKYDSSRFIYSPPPSPSAALEEAHANFISFEATKDGLIDAYLNGPRTLSNDRLSYLMLTSAPQAVPPSPPPTPTDDAPFTLNDIAIDDEVREFNLLICAVHFLGDGMALHTFANDLFTLLAGKGTEGSEPSNGELTAMLEREWTERWGRPLHHVKLTDVDVLPPTLEARLPEPLSTFQRVAHAVEFRCAQERLIGGHAFPKSNSPPDRKRHTVVPTVSLDQATTKRILSKCKSEGVSIAHVLFAASNIAWSRVGNVSPELPMMMYSALNLRPYLPLPSSSSSPLVSSYWFLAVGYFNVVLPSLSSDSPRTLWHRARLAKNQCIKAAKAPLLLPRTKLMAEERGNRARTFAAMDDGLPPTQSQAMTPPPTPAASPEPAQNPLSRRPPSTALLGLSLLGNLDAMYKHSQYPSITLHTLTTGSRQRKGGLLVFGYTFAGKLWMSLGYDKGAYKDEVPQWWNEVINQVAAIAQ